MEFIERIQQPQSLVTLACFLFSLGTVWATLNSRLRRAEEKIKSLEDLDLDAKLAKIMSDLERLKTAWENHNK